MFTDPLEDLGKPELMSIHRATDELIPFFGDDVEIEAVNPQKSIGCGECDALVSVYETVIVTKRLHEGSGFFFERVVVPGLGTENGGLNCALVADTVKAAE